MFKGFMKTIPQISIFHNSASPASQSALKLLKAALSSPYPPGASPPARPLDFDLEVVEHQPPTPDQLRTILSYLPAAPGPSALLSAHPTVDSTPTTEQGVSELAERNPNALKWPIVVDWHAGRAAVGDVDAVKALLGELGKKRDGEA